MQMDTWKKIQPQIENHEDKTVIRKRSNDGFYRMNHLTRLGEFDTDYEPGIIRRGKRTRFLPSKYLLESIQEFKDELDAKVAFLKETQRLGDGETKRSPDVYYN